MVPRESIALDEPEHTTTRKKVDLMLVSNACAQVPCVQGRRKAVHVRQSNARQNAQEEQRCHRSAQRHEGDEGDESNKEDRKDRRGRKETE